MHTRPERRMSGQSDAGDNETILRETERERVGDGRVPGCISSYPLLSLSRRNPSCEMRRVVIGVHIELCNGALCAQEEFFSAETKRQIKTAKSAIKE